MTIQPSLFDPVDAPTISPAPIEAGDRRDSDPAAPAELAELADTLPRCTPSPRMTPDDHQHDDHQHDDHQHDDHRRADGADGRLTEPPSDRSGPDFDVEVVRSARRKRTVGAQMVGGVLRIMVPSWMSSDEESHWVREMTRRYERAHRVGRIDLAARAATLARRFDLPMPDHVKWAGEMRTQWGSCTPADRTIRLADRLADMPPWVLDYVLVHEMAHIVEPNHSPAFWDLVHRYPRAERAIGFLLAKSNDPTDDPAPFGI